MNSSLQFTKWGRILAKKLMKPIQKYKPALQQKISRWNIVTGDLVKVINGPQSGQQGKVTHVLRKKHRVVVGGVNMRRRIIKPKMDGTPGRFVIMPCSLHYSNVMLVDPSIGEPTKITYQYLSDGSRVRVSKKTGQIIPKPARRTKPKSMIEGPKDTSTKDVHEVTFTDYEKFLPYIYASASKMFK